MILRSFVLLTGLLLSPALRAVSEENLYLPQPALPTPGPNVKQTANFDDLRHNILSLISTSQKRVWLMTDYLTDGDIVSALFLAKYRKVDVKVFLGQPRLNSYLSRLNYLKAQNIPVFTRPQHGFVAPTVLFIDQRLFTVSRDLNVLVRHGSAQIVQAPPSDVATFVSWFRGVNEYPSPAEAKPMPAVGRSGGSRPGRNWGAGGSGVSSYRGEDNGSFNYDRSGLSRQVPEGVSTKLPRMMRWQKLKEQGDKPLPQPVPSGGASITAPVPSVSPEKDNQPKLIEPGPTGPQEVIDPARPSLDEDAKVSPSEER